MIRRGGRLIRVPMAHKELPGTIDTITKQRNDSMKTNTKTLAAAALAGLFAVGTATAAVGHLNAEKDKCSGKDGCDGKKKDGTSILVAEKDKCSGKDGCDGKKKDGDKDKCSGKDGCDGKDKKASSIL